MIMQETIGISEYLVRSMISMVFSLEILQDMEVL